MLDLAVIQNRYKNNPPHPIIEEGSSIIGSDPVGEDEIIKGYLGSAMEPIKSTVPVRLSLIATKNGRSTFMMKFSCGS